MRVLFANHAKDLTRINPSVSGKFVCPTCFHVFSVEDLDKENILSVGHVWPQKFFRDRSPKANEQVILLCKSCNSKGGRTFDAAMQEMEKFLETQRNGDVYMRQIVDFIDPHDFTKKKIRMQLFVLQKDNGLSPEDIDKIVSNDGIVVRIPDNSVDTGFFPLIDETGRKHYSEADWALAKSYLQTGATVMMHPHDSDWSKGRISKKPKLWQVGLLTAAYLYAFHTFGYRYIFQASLDSVRIYIQDAFEKKVDSRLDFENTKTINVSSFPAYYQHPDIGFFNPFDDKIPHHLRVHFLGYAIWLPIQYTYVFQVDRANIPEQGGIMASAYGHLPHDGLCQWERLLGEPDHEIRDNTMVLRESEAN